MFDEDMVAVDGKTRPVQYWGHAEYDGIRYALMKMPVQKSVFGNMPKVFYELPLKFAKEMGLELGKTYEFEWKLYKSNNGKQGLALVSEYRNVLK